MISLCHRDELCVTWSYWEIIFSGFFFSVALRPNAGHGLLILEVSRSQKTTHHSRYDSSGRVISSWQRPLPNNTQHSQRTNIHAPVGLELTISAGERPQTYALDRAATGTGNIFWFTKYNYKTKISPRISISNRSKISKRVIKISLSYMYTQSINSRLRTGTLDFLCTYVKQWPVQVEFWENRNWIYVWSTKY